MFSRLKLGRVAGQVNQPEALGHNQVRLGVPAGVVEPKHDDALPSCPGPAPASRANSASSAAKNGLDTPFDTDQKVSPVAGNTKAVT